MDPIRRVGIVVKRNQPRALELARDLHGWLERRGAEGLLDAEAAGRAGLDGGVPAQELPGRVDLLLVLGGDGTLIYVAGLIGDEAVPILGANLGGLGFLTVLSLDEIESALERALEGELEIEERTRLVAELHRDGEVILSGDILNDVVINRGPLARIVGLETWIDGKRVAVFRADGLIVATPTGSTAYNLAAGGPIIEPELKAMVLNPICPHSLTARPLVLLDSSVVELFVQEDAEELYLTLDGQRGETLQAGDSIRIARSPRPIRLVRSPNRTDYEILKAKLHWGER